MNSTAQLMQAILFECVDPKYRGRLNSLNSLFRFTWSGSAVLGGWLADAQDYRVSFLWTAAIQGLAVSVRLPTLCMVPRFDNDSAAQQLRQPFRNDTAIDAERGTEVQ